MKKTLLTLALILPTLVFASPVSVDRLTNDHIEPLVKTDYFQASYLKATSTTATSTLAGSLAVNGATRLSTSLDGLAWLTGGFVSGVATSSLGLQPVGNYITALTGEVTATGPGSVGASVADNVIDEANLKVNTATNGWGLTASSTSSGGMVWAPFVAPVILDTGTDRRYFGYDATTAAQLGDALVAAQTAAVSGDLIIVAPGAYTVPSSLGKDGVDWYFYPNAVLTGASGINVWEFYGSTEFDIDGYGQFVGNNSIGIKNGTSGYMEIHASRVVGDGIGMSAVESGTGTFRLYVYDEIVSNDYDGVWMSAQGGDMYVNTPFISAADNAIETTDGDVDIYPRISGYIGIASSTNGLNLGGFNAETDLYIGKIEKHSTSASQYAIVSNPGALGYIESPYIIGNVKLGGTRLVNSHVYGYDTATSTILLTDDTVLDNVRVTSTSTATYSITADSAMSLGVVGTFVHDRPIGPNVTVAYGPTVDSTTGTTTIPVLKVTTAINLLGTYITNLSTWFNGLFDTQLATKTTDNLTQGSTNKYNQTHTGDATGATALTLATVNSNVGSFGSATQAGTFTVNGKGLITAAGSTTVTPAVGSITGLGTGVGTWLATPSSANLASAVTGETGSGALVFGTQPTFTTDLTSPTIYGSSSSGGSLTLRSTSNATRGLINLGSYSAYDDVNGRLGIGTTSPTALLEVGTTTSGTNDALQMVVHSRGSTGTVATNYGMYDSWKSENPAGGVTEALRHVVYYAGTSDGTDAFTTYWQQTSLGGLKTILSFGAQGQPTFYRYLPTGGYSSLQAAGSYWLKKGNGTLSDGAGPRVLFQIDDNTGTGYIIGGFGAAYSFTASTSDIIFTARSGPSDTTASTKVLSAGGNRHLEYFGSAPTISTCGTTPSVVGNDNAFTITTGTGAPTACTATFASAWTNAPVCNVNLSAGTATITSVSTSAITFGFSAGLTSGKVYVGCKGYQ